MEIFFAKEIKDGVARFDDNDSYHCIKVLRHKTGDTIRFTDGKGAFYEGIIKEASSKNCLAEIKSIEKAAHERDYYLHIAVSPLKSGERYEWFLEKATEIGIDEITPIITERSERSRINNDRGEKIVLSAMKQSLKCNLPKLNHAIKLKEFINSKLSDYKGVRIIAHCNTGNKEHISDLISRYKNMGAKEFLILIGPEGDFSREEVEFAQSNNFQAITMGNSRLRSETAAIAAVLCFYTTPV